MSSAQKTVESFCALLTRSVDVMRCVDRHVTGMAGGSTIGMVFCNVSL